jgi:hypothetical protein
MQAGLEATYISVGRAENPLFVSNDKDKHAMKFAKGIFMIMKDRGCYLLTMRNTRVHARVANG